MSRNISRYDLLQSLGIEQLEPLMAIEFILEEEEGEVLERTATIPCIMTRPVSQPCTLLLQTTHTDICWLVQVQGVRCPACSARGQTIWVVPGKCCPQCGTPVHKQQSATYIPLE